MRLSRTLRGRGTVLVPLFFALASACSDYTSAPYTGGPVPPSATEVVFCNGSEPSWVAFQDGDGAWTRALPVTAAGNVRFRNAFTSTRAGIATARVFSNLTLVSVQYGDPAELQIVGDTLPEDCSTSRPKTLLGTVAGIDTSEVAVIGSSFIRTTVFPEEGLNFALGGLSEGPQDILASRSSRTDRGKLTRLIYRHTSVLPDSTTLPLFDFASPESFAPAIANLTIMGLPPGGGSASSSLRTATGEGLIAFLTSPTTAITRPYYAVPRERLQTGDLHVLAVAAGSASLNGTRTATMYFHAPVDQTLTLGAPMSSPALSVVATAPALRLRARFDSQADYDQQTAITYRQSGGPIVTVAMTATYASRLATGYDLVLPDLSVVAGFDASWTLRSHDPVFWTAFRIGGTLGLGLDAIPVDGSRQRTADGAASFQP